jgi:steroid delta-isomerase-like uncharacterized protein
METSAATTNTDQIRDVTERWMAGWNSHDSRALVTLIAPGLEYVDPAWPETMRSAGDVQAFTAACWRAMPDMHFTEPVGLLIADDGVHATAPWHMSATFSGPMDPPGFAPTGGRVELDGVDVFEVRGGKIAGLVTHYDMMGLARSLGVMPPRGSRAERASVKLQNLLAKRRR